MSEITRLLKQGLLRGELERIIDRTAGAESVEEPAVWAGDSAGERRAMDDQGSGRLPWRAANRNARDGLVALDAGDEEAAKACLSHAKRLLIAAYEAVITLEQISGLNTSARRRGSDGQELHQRLADAVLRQKALGLKGKAAIAAAFKADPDLEAECRNMKTDAIKKAVTGRKP